MTSSNPSQQLVRSDFSPSPFEHGYDVDGLEEINPRFKCIFCFHIIREPIQLIECGHRSCRECFEYQAATTTDGNVECPCEDCHEKTNKDNIMIDKAFKRELNDLRVVCFRKNAQCTWTGLLKDYQKHLDETHSHFNCSACNKLFPTRATLDAHMKICSEIFDECRFGILCTEDMIPKNEFLNHLQSEKHQVTLMKFVTGEYHHPPEPPSNPESSSNPEAENHLNKELEERIFKNRNDLSAEVRKNESENSKFTEESEALHHRTIVLAQELNTVHITSKERLPILQSIQPFHEKLQKEIGQVHELCEDNQHISTDGTLTWRVTDVAEKMADAQSERQTSIYSPIFYSSRTGYQMRARLFLFGDGNARRTHMSLFFLLMRGEFDSILKWPFHFKVTFCLLDQTGNNRHIIDSFYPDVKSTSFQRPRDAANTASGIPKFFPLPMLLQDDNAYVRENTLYIRIIIALNDTPKSLLPFMLTLNPALPSYVQDNLINQEAAKQQANTASS